MITSCGRCGELMAKIRELEAYAFDLQAELDRLSKRAVFVVPGSQHLQAAMESLRSGELREGDVIRVHGAEEYVWQDGAWTRNRGLDSP